MKKVHDKIKSNKKMEKQRWLNWAIQVVLDIKK